MQLIESSKQFSAAMRPHKVQAGGIVAHESAQAPELMASVIIPVYNKEDYLEACFASLLEQTISRDALEVIFIDDGSSDGSLGILGDFAAGHPWARVIAKENGGVSSARNAG